MLGYAFADEAVTEFGGAFLNALLALGNMNAIFGQQHPGVATNTLEGRIGRMVPECLPQEAVSIGDAAHTLSLLDDMPIATAGDAAGKAGLHDHWFWSRVISPDGCVCDGAAEVVTAAASSS